MILRASDIIIPLKHFIDWMIDDYGVYLFMGFAGLCLITIAWVLSGGLRRGGSSNDHGVSVGLIIYPPNPSQPPLDSDINLSPRPHDFDHDWD